MLSGSQWDYWEYTVRKIRDLSCRMAKSIQPICDGFPASLCTYVSLDNMCGLAFVASATAATDPFLFSNLPGTQRPDARLYSAVLTFDTEDLKTMYPAYRALVSSLICPEAEIEAVQGLEESNTDMFCQ